jgi:2-keto-3-deoxy-L-rhamnonate aldolase RhmA
MTLGNQRKGSIMFQRNRMLGMLENKQLPLGIQMFTADAALIEVVGATGFDFVMLDSEHSGAKSEEYRGSGTCMYRR